MFKKFCLALVSYVITFAGCNALHGSPPGSSAKLEDNGKLAPQSLFSNQFAVHISGGDHTAERLAGRHGFVNQGKVSVHVVPTLYFRLLFHLLDLDF